MKRNTLQKKAIKQVFLAHDRPLKIDEILEYASKSVESLNQSTVYRNLNNLVEEGWLKRLSIPSIGTLYEQAECEHHHHFHCRKCDRVYDLPGCALKEDHEVPDGFVVEDHEIFFSGTCGSCSNKE